MDYKINPSTQEEEIEDIDKKNNHRFRDFIFTTLILFGIYALAGYATQNVGSENFKSWGKRYSLLRWPMRIINYNTEYDDYCDLKTTSSGLCSVFPSNKKESIEEITRDIDNGSMTIEAGEKMIKEIGDSYLGKGNTGKIIDIVNDNNLSPEEAAKKIMYEVPTGLPGPLDKLSKDVAKKILETQETSSNNHPSGNKREKSPVETFLDDQMKRYKIGQ
jgi:hypothetical protein